ncbi:hypothetical protein [Phytoactinopolyspora halophila]|uniref:hypothetical protein n=1 Tax=Phytoactinopolyspora halophila TaxID=1981511 RepID=UPI000F4E6353|nr:hypothetical protein [Phytoactinopolyspora halophila]
MKDPGRGMARVVRGLILATTCLGMSLAAHVAAGGVVHLSVDVVAGGLALSAMCVAAADTRRSFGGILGVVVLSQLVLHLFAGAGGHHGEVSSYGWTPTMLASHVIAAVVLSALLAHGERLVWALWGLTRLLPRVPPVQDVSPPAGPAPSVLQSYRPICRNLRDLCLSGPGTRAPPAGLPNVR